VITVTARPTQKVVTVKGFHQGWMKWGVPRPPRGDLFAELAEDLEQQFGSHLGQRHEALRAGIA
jgi:hypothetical protein